MTGPAAPRPGISVVLPVRDDAPALRSCLAALARQDRAPLVGINPTLVADLAAMARNHAALTMGGGHAVH